MKVLRPGMSEDARRFGGSTPLTAELDAQTITDYKLERALKRFGRALAEQMATRYTEPGSGPVIGVDLSRIEFSLILGSKKEKTR